MPIYCNSYTKQNFVIYCLWIYKLEILNSCNINAVIKTVFIGNAITFIIKYFFRASYKINLEIILWKSLN